MFVFLVVTNEWIIFQISLAAMVAVNPRVRCLQEPAWSWGRQGRGGTRSVWKETSPDN